MSIEKLKEYISGITALNSDAMKKAQERLDSLVKPPGSLGKQLHCCNLKRLCLRRTHVSV